MAEQLTEEHQQHYSPGLRVDLHTQQVLLLLLVAAVVAMVAAPPVLLLLVSVVWFLQPCSVLECTAAGLLQTRRCCSLELLWCDLHQGLGCLLLPDALPVNLCHSSNVTWL